MPLLHGTHASPVSSGCEPGGHALQFPFASSGTLPATATHDTFTHAAGEMEPAGHRAFGAQGVHVRAPNASEYEFAAQMRQSKSPASGSP